MKSKAKIKMAKKYKKKHTSKKAANSHASKILKRGGKISKASGKKGSKIILEYTF